MAREKLTVHGEPLPETGEWVTFKGTKHPLQVIRFHPSRVLREQGVYFPETWKCRDSKGKPYTFMHNMATGEYDRRFGFHFPEARNIPAQKVGA